MRWWCAAQGAAWSWQWQAYPGVWLFVGAFAGSYWLAAARPWYDAGPRRLLRKASFGLGVLTLWIALDWPVGALGSGYLAWVHMVQFLLIALVAPPLLLTGLPARVRLPVRPGVGLAVFHTVVVATHWPAIVDGMMATQTGSFAFDIVWLAAGLAFWAPLVRPARPMHFGMQAVYLLASTVLLTLPYIFLTFAELPFYATYELAPPVGPLSSAEDQRMAGLLMRIGGGIVLWTATGVCFWRWYQTDRDGPAGGKKPLFSTSR